MQRLLGSGLLLVFAIALVAVYPLQWRLRSEAREHMRALIHAQGCRMEGLLSIDLPLWNGSVADPRFAWEEENEFSLNGSMFDVIEQRIQGDRLHLLCVADGNEDALIAQAKRTDPNGQPGGDVPLSMLLSVAGSFLPPEAHRVPLIEPACAAPIVRRNAPALSAGHGQVPFRPPTVPSRA